MICWSTSQGCGCIGGVLKSLSTLTTRCLSRNGFTLVEMALVLLIMGLLMRATIVPLGALLEHRHRKEADEQLLEIKQAVFAHVVAYGALPCPVASGNLKPVSLPKNIHRQSQSNSNLALAGKPCLQHNGGVPARALGLSGALSATDALLDPWGREYLYAVSLNSHAELGEPTVPDWTTPGEASRVGVPNLSASISVCRESYPSGCPSTSIRADQIAFLVLSSSRNTQHTESQTENLDNDDQFVLKAESSSTDDPFDDQLVWGTAADVIYWMLKMGWLP